MATALVAYVPVIQAGYLKFIQKHRSIKQIFIIADNYVAELSELHTEIRALEAKKAATALSALLPTKSIQVVSPTNLIAIRKKFDHFVVANDTISRRFAAKYLPDKKITYGTAWLRWDEASVYSRSDVHYDRISTSTHDQKLIEQAADEAINSADWWRQVGAVAIFPNQTNAVSHNQHVPIDYSVYIDGDPRDVIPAGQNSEFNTVLHAEQAIITEAARRGESLQNADLYLTVFPCPMCAKQIAAGGIKRVFFASGHASLDGETVLKAAGVELIYVQR